MGSRWMDVSRQRWVTDVCLYSSNSCAGIWLSAAQDQPFATVIESSNYGPRSATRDMEANLLITTTNAELKQHLGDEVSKINQHTTKVDAATFVSPDRKVGLGVRFSAWVIRDML